MFRIDAMNIYDKENDINLNLDQIIFITTGKEYVNGKPTDVAKITLANSETLKVKPSLADQIMEILKQDSKKSGKAKAN